MRRALTVSLALCVLLLIGAGASSAAGSLPVKTAIAPAPAWTADQLAAPAGDDWISNMGNLAGWRYSSLNQITPANVANLKLAWKINLGTCADKNATCGSLEANAVVYKGTYFIQTPKSDVFALDATTGAQLWHFVPSLGVTGCVPTGSCEPGQPFNVGTGGRQPGVSIGQGKVFAPQRDGSVVAIDQMLGGQVWKSELMPWQKGGRVSATPMYFNGMLIIGDSGGDGGSPSNSMHALDASTGARIWSWTTVPRPGQPGSDTWTQQSGSGSAYGGGAMWENALIDPKLNLAIFGTGNTEPWNSRGPGMNLYTDSIVALNVYTGQLVWAYQTTHHDLWDSDLPNNGVLFTAEYKVPVTKTVVQKYKVRVAYKVRVKGKLVTKHKFVTKTRKKTVTTEETQTRPATAFVNKYGYTFILDEETGKPIGQDIKETPVPVSTAPDVNSWPTQPIPQGDRTTDDPTATDGSKLNCADGNQTQTNAYIPFAQATAPDGKPYKIGCTYSPYDTTQYVVTPFEEMDWPASSYSPENHTFITCGVSARARGFEQIPKASQVIGAFGGTGAAVLGTGDTSTSNFGNFSALDVTNAKFAWHQKWPSPCYSGSMNTASGITFIGWLGVGNAQDGHGFLQAVDTKTGANLWKSDLMSAPVGAPPVTYTVNGKQYVSVAVGGQSHNDVSRPAGLTNPLRLRDDAIYTFALP